MKPVALVPFSQDSQALANVAAGQQAKKAANPKSAETLKAAREFEALLLRHVLESLQKTTQLSGSEKNRSNAAYQSMAVDALSDGIARAGGLGLADLIAHTLESEIAGSKPR
ncbi:MAG TPA: rod-binding protein [Polyangiaceae bacterium]